jgi:hypothetical protein
VEHPADPLLPVGLRWMFLVCKQCTKYKYKHM